MKKLGLYIHMPFCRSKCAYCDFYSLPDFDMFKQYFNALMLHMEDYRDACSAYEVDTVYLGGGTPSIAPPKLIASLIDSIYANFKVPVSAEFSMEANPATLNKKSLRLFNSLGINRLSIGCQSTYDNELAALSRIHTYDDFESSYELAREVGFENINVDLMYGIPEQTPETLIQSLNRICDLGPEHISLYGLKIEEGTPFAARRDSLILPDEDTEYNMYSDAVAYLAKCGYKQYEISNFASEGYECKHNLKYWNCEEYLGFGPAAHSYFGNRRFSFKPDVAAYINAIEDVASDAGMTDENYEISSHERVGEYIMLRMRLNDGVDIIDFKRRFGLDFEEMYSDLLGAYIESGFIDHRDTKYSFTTKGMFVSNYILSAMLDFDSESEKSVLAGADK